jgi:prepilin-type N-terminal cleavage/methylation domain-containing protein
MAFWHGRKRPHHGFTVMEILVTIIMVAMLSSISGQMIVNVVDQGRVSACKKHLDALAKALRMYKQDVGFFPWSLWDDVYGSRGSFLNAEVYCMGSYQNNVLVKVDATEWNMGGWHPWENHPKVTESQYRKRWKGPYMGGNPEEMFLDPWKRSILYIPYNQALYLVSAGPNGIYDFNWSVGGFDPFDPVFSDDDIIVKIAPQKYTGLP